MLVFNLPESRRDSEGGRPGARIRWTEWYGGVVVLVEFSVVPLGKGSSVSQYVAECIRIVKASGLPYKLNPMGTVIEGEYDDVMSVVRACHTRVMGMADRVITTVKIDDRKGVRGMIDGKVRSVEEKVGEVRV